MMQRANPQLAKELANSSKFSNSSAGPPFNLEVEQALLGAILVNNLALERVADFVEPGHFYDQLHQAIYEVLRQVIGRGELANPLTLKSFFEHAEPIDETLTVPGYLGKLAANAATIINAKDYGRTIVDLDKRRQLIIIGEDLVLGARDAAVDYPPSSLIEEAEARLFSLVEKGEQKQAQPFNIVIGKALSATLRAVAGDKPSIPTRFVDLDAKMGGMQSTDLIIIAGRPSMGKTALVTNIAVNVAKAGAVVDFYSLEMSDEQIGMRVLGDFADVPPERLRKGDIDRAKRDHLQDLALAAAKLPIFVDDTGGLSIAQLSARARRNKRRHGTQLIVVDYLQLMQSGRRRENRVQDITEITVGLKALAKELAVPVVALSQLSRNVEHRENKRPQLSDLRESGSIEQDADIVLFVFREEYYVEREQPSVTDHSAYADWQAKLRQCAGKAEVIIGKARHGPTGTVAMAFSGEMTRFSDLAREVARP